MRVFFGLDNLPLFESTVVTVGSFDGVHRGHKALLTAAVNKARAAGAESVAVTFWPHPRQVLKKDEKTWLLSPIEEKLCLIASAGIANTVVIPFDERFSRLSYRDFIGDIVIGRLHSVAMVVGYDHRFGHNKGGDYQNLLGVIAGRKFEVVRIGELKGEHVKISSTSVREAIVQKDFKTVCNILGHRYFLFARVGVPVQKEDISVLDDSYDAECHFYRLELPHPDKLLPSKGIYNIVVFEREDFCKDGGSPTENSYKGALVIDEANRCFAAINRQLTPGMEISAVFL